MFFDAIYILNIHGNGVTLGKKLQQYGITKCSVITDPDQPKRPQPHHRSLYYMRDALDDAIENNYSTVLLLEDDVFVHKKIQYEFSRIVSALSE